ncbi:SUKH-4 family immunity protein [Streptomyces chitinivorans]|uniref:SUKH-4 family immunity protein n=1 Tax=Streptomyces chitinivorans TaxID=1257027 RepID=A0ABW7HXK3_9ACTN|nr:SUKH-4 family immunity protein [Streptomyces chitinivorans]MDH2407524.1 SUKH-4 family immunity protein [Streptomyces chitinivorans]
MSEVTPNELTRAYGLTGVVYFPHYSTSALEFHTKNFLSSTGVPHDEIFTSRADVNDPEPDPIELGPLLELDDQKCPEERRDWLALGYLRTALIALDPRSGMVHAYPEGELESHPLHRDVESFAFCMIEFKKLRDAKSADADVALLVQDFRESVTAHDSTPFRYEDSEWNLVLDEIRDGIW